MISGLLSTLLGGFLALAGVLLGPFFQRKHERWLAFRSDQALLREKAEQLFDELDRITDQSHAATMSSLKNAQDENREIIPVPDLGKIRAISTVYFPSILPLIDEYEEKRSSSAKIVLNYWKDAMKKGGISPTEMKAMQVMVVTEHGTNASELVTAVRKHLCEIVPRLQ